jgi:hypothetical protein
MKETKILAVLAALAAACGSGSIADPQCVAPAKPQILAPAPGSTEVTEAVVLTSSPYQDPDLDPQQASEFEIWIVAGGVPVERVWGAMVMDPAKLTSVTLADGAWEGSAAATGRFAEWANHVVRVRHRDMCGAWSEWSDDVPFRTDDGSAYLFDPDAVHTVQLEIPPDSWTMIDAQAVGPWPYVPDRSYYSGTLTFDGVVYEGVGIRVKGGCGSSRPLSGKAAFKISLGWDDPNLAGCPADRRLYGQKHLTLNNGVQDAGFERERLGYTLFRAFGLPAPRASHVQLFVNGENWGLYLHVESFDRRFLDRHFPSKQGMLYEGGPFCDVIPEQIPPGAGDACFDREFSTDMCDTPENGDDPTDWELLRELANQIAALPPGGFTTGVQAFFDWDEFLSSWAINAVLGNWDGYQYGNINNYRMYHDPSTGRWSIIQSGIDNTFDSAPGWDFWGIAAVLATRCFQESECTAAFAARVHAAADLFESLDLATEAQRIRTQIAAIQMADPRKEVSYDTALAAHQSLVNWIGGRPAEVRSSLAGHGF